jgi:hypothetical protein
MKKFTFEILTLAGDWKPVFCRSMNSTDPETGCSIIACRDAKPYATYGTDAAKADQDYFSRFAGADRIRIKL